MPVRFIIVAALTVSLYAVSVQRAMAAEPDVRVAEAAMREDRAAVRSLILKKADVNAPLVDGTTALHWAVRAEDLETAGLLIKAGANVKAQDRYGVTALSLASSIGNAAIVRQLLDAGANPDSADSSGETVLMAATRSGATDAVLALLKHGAAVNTRDAVTEQTALMWAVRANHGAAVTLLLEHAADVNARTRTGKTPLWTPQNFGGGSHGIGIIRGGWPERGFRAEIPGAMTALLYAARDGRLDLVRQLLAAKADVNQAEANGITPLLMAVTNDHMDVARFLVDQGADINASDWWGRTPLWAAVEIRNRDYTRTNEHGIDRAAVLEIFKSLLARGANPNARTKEIPPIRRWVMPLSDLSWVEMTGQTPFIRAAVSGDITVMRLLLDKGADPNILTEGGTSALMAAAGLNWVVQQSYTEPKESLLQAVQICLEKGADVNAANSAGQTAVMGAANRGSDDILRLLVKSGARLDVADKQGRTPTRWAYGEFLALHPPEKKPGTIALIEELMGESAGRAGHDQ
jgi:uncharacterized protein